MYCTFRSMVRGCIRYLVVMVKIEVQGCLLGLLPLLDNTHMCVCVCVWERDGLQAACYPVCSWYKNNKTLSHTQLSHICTAPTTGRRHTCSTYLHTHTHRTPTPIPPQPFAGSGSIWLDAASPRKLVAARRRFPPPAPTFPSLISIGEQREIHHRHKIHKLCAHSHTHMYRSGQFGSCT